jgi:hypothetical protein
MRFIVKELLLTFLASYSSNKQEYPVSMMLGAPYRAFLLYGTGDKPER